MYSCVLTAFTIKRTNINITDTIFQRRWTEIKKTEVLQSVLMITNWSFWWIFSLSSLHFIDTVVYYIVKMW